MRAPALVVVTLVVTLTACSHTVNVRVEAPHTKVVVDGKDLGNVPSGGRDVEVPLGWAPVTYEIENTQAPADTKNVVGSLPRTEPVWWMLALGIGGALCFAPTAAGVGFCIANPAVIGAPLVFAVTGDTASLLSSCVAPSWFTLPLVTSCGAVGLSPLALAFAAETLPDAVVIHDTVHEAPSAPAAAPTPAVRF